MKTSLLRLSCNIPTSLACGLSDPSLAFQQTVNARGTYLITPAITGSFQVIYTRDHGSWYVQTLIRQNKIHLICTRILQVSGKYVLKESVMEVCEVQLNWHRNCAIASFQQKDVMMDIQQQRLLHQLHPNMLKAGQSPKTAISAAAEVPHALWAKVLETASTRIITSAS